MHPQKPVVMVPVVAGAVIRKDKKFLLVQEAQPKAYGLWNFPAGRVDEGDTIEQTAVKEAHEESGFEVELVKKIGIYQDEAMQPPKHAFSARIIGGELGFPKDEILDAQWFSLSEIEAMKEKGELRDAWVYEAVKIVEDNLESYT